jgi:hypothetical protein
MNYTPEPRTVHLPALLGIALGVLLGAFAFGCALAIFPVEYVLGMGFCAVVLLAVIGVGR